ncbi:MAG: hypothetical protein KGJ80_00640 [Chloroflexota bacterium]|nr:hypothetical protein [Chloroflexota bacterium]
MRARIISLCLVLVAFLLLAPAASSVFACMPEPDYDSGCARWRTKSQPTQSSTPVPLAVNAAATPKGDSPDTARPIDDTWQTIDPGANIWFKTDNSDGYRIIELWVDSNAPNGIGLSVFSPDQYLDGLGVNSKPIGRREFQ